jgi:hypothetical protein
MSLRLQFRNPSPTHARARLPFFPYVLRQSPGSLFFPSDESFSFRACCAVARSFVFSPSGCALSGFLFLRAWPPVFSSVFFFRFLFLFSPVFLSSFVFSSVFCFGFFSCYSSFFLFQFSIFSSDS